MRSSALVLASSGTDGLASADGEGEFPADPAGSMRLELTFG
ncbi:MAG TPA: hypothetical protein VE623_01820 [Acidimicrobiales bacterium]|nr:hypothetical protein [Acidimicrobiales bacterium]